MARSKAFEKRDLILETAKRLFADRGIAVSMGEIADEIGIPVGSIYTYFDSKQALVEIIIEEGWNEFRAWVEAGLSAMGAHGSPGGISTSNTRDAGDVREKSLRSLSFLVNRALPMLFSDVDLIMLLLAEASTSAKLEEKLQYMSEIIARLVADCASSGAPVADPRLYSTGITVMLLGALETLRITSKTDLGVSVDDIQRFLRQVAENALGEPLPDMD